MCELNLPAYFGSPSSPPTLRLRLKGLVTGDLCITAVFGLCEVTTTLHKAHV